MIRVTFFTIRATTPVGGFEGAVGLKRGLGFVTRQESNPSGTFRQIPQSTAQQPRCQLNLLGCTVKVKPPESATAPVEYGF